MSFWGAPFLSPEPGGEEQGGALSRNLDAAGSESSPQGAAAAQEELQPSLSPGVAATRGAPGPPTCPSPTTPLAVSRTGLSNPASPAPSLSGQGTHHCPRLVPRGQLEWAKGTSSPGPTCPERVTPRDVQNMGRELTAQWPKGPRGIWRGGAAGLHSNCWGRGRG